MSLISQLRTVLSRRSAYRSTLHALRGIPEALAEDTGIYPGDARRLAREAIYG